MIASVISGILNLFPHIRFGQDLLIPPRRANPLLEDNLKTWLIFNYSYIISLQMSSYTYIQCQAPKLARTVVTRS